ncbi:hypothetical protein X798_01668, partial [Onchocerca flexuosa]
MWIMYDLRNAWNSILLFLEDSSGVERGILHNPIEMSQIITSMIHFLFDCDELLDCQQ